MNEWWFLAWPDRTEAVQINFKDMKGTWRYDEWVHARGPFPTEWEAEDARYQDTVPGYWEHNLAVYADHCPGCGRWAKRLAGDDSFGGWHWKVTDCKKCGIIDSRG